MAETEETKVTCPECGHDVGTKEGGTKIKVHKVAGERCDGSESEVQSSDTDPEGLDKGDPFEALESDEDDEQGPNDSEDPADENGAQTDAQSSEGGGQFVHTVTVSHSCPYLDDQAWHHENAKVAAKVAQQAGHVLAGGEAKYTETVPDGESLHVRYTVPVK
jgi:ssDNA-binding Zn-finger/Zn-ribbon topoisomerase 1